MTAPYRAGSGTHDPVTTRSGDALIPIRQGWAGALGPAAQSLAKLIRQGVGAASHSSNSRTDLSKRGL